MIEVKLTATRTARFWLGELPTDALAPTVASLRGKKYAAKARAIGRRSAAVELHMPITPRTHYALLGGTFVPHADPEFWLEAPWGTEVLAGGPAWGLDGNRAMRGLTKEYARSVISTDLEPNLGAIAGVVSVTHAVTSQLHTAPVVIRTAVVMLLKVLFDPAIAESDQSLRTMAMDAIRDGILVRR